MPRSNPDLLDGRENAAAFSSLTREGIAKIIENERSVRNQCTFSERIIQRATRACGSILSIWFHAAGFSAWIAANTLLPEQQRWDPYPFTFLTLVVSLEAIFLSTFILVTANRDSVLSERRAYLDLQVNLLAERENTKMLLLLNLMAQRLGVELKEDAETKALARDIDPADLLEKIDDCMKENPEVDKANV